MEPSAIMSPANYSAKIFSYSQAITLSNHRRIVQSRKVDHVRTTSPSLKLPALIKECDNAEVIGARESKGKEWIHFVGVGGCGLSALAMLALKQGYEVSGSDVMWSNAMEALREAGARVYIGHSELHLRKNNGSVPDALVLSSAIRGGNVEILHAESVGVPVYKRGAWLGRITQGYNLIAVSGSHGKTTTASMLSYVLNAMGNDLTAVIGAWVPQLDERNIICGTGCNFVLEADEYDCCFLGVTPQITVVTNIDWEHVDMFQDEEAVKTIFRKFIGQIRVGGHLILCGDWKHLLKENNQLRNILFTAEICPCCYFVGHWPLEQYSQRCYSCTMQSSLNTVLIKLCLNQIVDAASRRIWNINP